METDENLRERRAGGSQRVIIRDDQMDFTSLLDVVKERRRKNLRLGLADSGVFDPFRLEWLGEAGADVYTSDRARQNLGDFILIGRATKRGGATTACFYHGTRGSAEKKPSISFAELGEMGRSGIDIHLSNKFGAREWPALEELAEACRAGEARLVYYHHGPLTSEIESLVRRGGWVHVSDSSLGSQEDAARLADCAAAARARGIQIIFHLERVRPLDWLEDIFAAGAAVLFKMPPTDYRSPLRPFERAAKKSPPDFRSFYIDATFVP